MNWFKRQRFVHWALAALFLLNLLTLAALWRSHRHRPHRQEKAERLIAEKLSLTDEQQDHLKQLRMQHKQSMLNLHKQMRQQRKMLFTMLQEEHSIDTAKRNERMERIAEIQKKMELQTFQHFENLKEELDSTQQKDLEALLHSMIRHMHPFVNGPADQFNHHHNKPKRGRGNH